MAENATSDSFAWNFSGAPFSLANPIGGLLVYNGCMKHFTCQIKEELALNCNVQKLCNISTT